MKTNTGILSLTLSAWSALAGALLLSIPNQALAYIDPGAGSMLVQLILGGTAGLLFIGRLFWVGLKGRIMKPFSRNREQPAPALNGSSEAMAPCCAKSSSQNSHTAPTPKARQHAL